MCSDCGCCSICWRVQGFDYAFLNSCVYVYRRGIIPERERIARLLFQTMRLHLLSKIHRSSVAEWTPTKAHTHTSIRTGFALARPSTWQHVARRTLTVFRGANGKGIFMCSPDYSAVVVWSKSGDLPNPILVRNTSSSRRDQRRDVQFSAQTTEEKTQSFNWIWCFITLFMCVAFVWALSEVHLRFMRIHASYGRSTEQTWKWSFAV